MSTTRISLIVLGFIAIVAYFTLFTVLEVKNAIVLQFGDPKRVITEPGLNFKIPFIQNVIFIDNRILDIDAPAAEVGLMVDPYRGKGRVARHMRPRHYHSAARFSGAIA